MHIHMFLIQVLCEQAARGGDAPANECKKKKGLMTAQVHNMVTDAYQILVAFFPFFFFFCIDTTQSCYVSQKVLRRA